MSNHPYLRAYLAGISVPTPLLLIPDGVLHGAICVQHPGPGGALLAAEVAFGRLHRRMAQQELNLLDLAAAGVA
jgi:hypothetical protein